MLISEYFSWVNYNPLAAEPGQPPACFSLEPKFSSVRQLFPPVIFLPLILCVKTDGGGGGGGGGGGATNASLSSLGSPYHLRGGYRKCYTTLAALRSQSQNIATSRKICHIALHFRMSHFCPIFAAGMKNSSVGNLLTCLKDTFIFDSEKQSKRLQWRKSLQCNARDIWPGQIN